jgi:sporadic carbohydrate cluster protein (TIGR04323 family)
MSYIISYVNNTTEYTRGIPIHLQRLMMAQYATEQKLVARFEQLEIEVMTHLPTLLHILEVDRPESVLLFSVYALPSELELRQPLYDAALQNGVSMLFANEGQTLRNQSDVAHIERILGFSRLS